MMNDMALAAQKAMEPTSRELSRLEARARHDSNAAARVVPSTSAQAKPGTPNSITSFENPLSCQERSRTSATYWAPWDAEPRPSPRNPDCSNVYQTSFQEPETRRPAVSS